MSKARLGIEECLQEISTRPSDASAVAKAAVTYAQSGSGREATRIAMDLDEVLHEVRTLHGAMLLLSRMERSAVAAAPG